jgi:hypothetical protein
MHEKLKKGEGQEREGLRKSNIDSEFDQIHDMYVYKYHNETSLYN